MRSALKSSLKAIGPTDVSAIDQNSLVLRTIALHKLLEDDLFATSTIFDDNQFFSISFLSFLIKFIYNYYLVKTNTE
jgi:hypothetical protein